MSIHDRAIHSQGREMCLALATICECCSEWDGARTLRHAAEYLYREKYRSMMTPVSLLTQTEAMLDLLKEVKR